MQVCRLKVRMQSWNCFIFRSANGTSSFDTVAGCLVLDVDDDAAEAAGYLQLNELLAHELFKVGVTNQARGTRHFQDCVA